MFYAYILKCKGNKLYIGCTNDLKQRIARHTKGYVSATKGKLPVKVVNYVAFDNKYRAYNFEKYLKSGSGRAFVKKHFIVSV
ncbi:MAG: excinuclease ABC subunit C [Candidatus Moranbacteria bacterium RBG_19FT_COMBO_42_6]|nr:MAG: excinuclease ABC subunit C [Candidatus Moranbacteria bacterium RBG_19FT_COMBO_42_6]